MRVTVVGLGYVGLVTAACLAEWDHVVVGVDADPRRLDALQSGLMPFHEPRLPQLVANGVASGRLTFTADLTTAAADADVVVVAVGTHDGNGGWQTDTVRGCLADLVPVMARESTLVLRSTLPPDFIRQLPTLVSAGASRRSSVSGLNVRPSSATRRPLTVPSSNAAARSTTCSRRR